MKPGIPKFRKENHPERARNKTGPIFSHLLSGYESFCFSIAKKARSVYCMTNRRYADSQERSVSV
jgi:hypothetical protein